VDYTIRGEDSPLVHGNNLAPCWPVILDYFARRRMIIELTCVWVYILIFAASLPARLLHSGIDTFVISAFFKLCGQRIIDVGHARLARETNPPSQENLGPVKYGVQRTTYYLRTKSRPKGKGCVVKEKIIQAPQSYRHPSRAHPSPLTWPTLVLAHAGEETNSQQLYKSHVKPPPKTVKTPIIWPTANHCPGISSSFSFAFYFAHVIKYLGSRRVQRIYFGFEPKLPKFLTPGIRVQIGIR
jgi:hypothetical protein